MSPDYPNPFDPPVQTNELKSHTSNGDGSVLTSVSTEDPIDAPAQTNDPKSHTSNGNGSVLASAPTEPTPTDKTAPKRSPQGKSWLWGILAVVLIGGGGFVGWKFLSNRKAAPPPPAPPPLPVKVQTVQPSQVQSTAEFVGALEAQQRVSLQPQIQGRVDRVFVSSGDRVRRGTPIVSLSLDQTTADVSSARAVVNSNRAAVASAQAQFESKKADRVKAESDVKLQQVKFKRTQYLVSQGALARQDLDTAQKDLDAAIATVDATAKQVNAAQASINQAQSNVQQAQAQVASNQVNLKAKQVVAPLDGIVGDFSVKVGDYVSTGATLTTITKNDIVDMRIAVPSNNAAQLRQGLPVELLDANTGKRLTAGSINFISPQVNTSAQSILVKARFANPDDKLRDGQFVRARIVWNEKPGILIPTQAVNRIGGQSFVFLVAEDKSSGKPQFVVHQKPVKLGEVQNERYPVLDGIKAGDRVAISNILKLREGVPIQPESPQSSQSPQSPQSPQP